MLICHYSIAGKAEGTAKLNLLFTFCKAYDALLKLHINAENHLGKINAFEKLGQLIALYRGKLTQGREILYTLYQA